MKKTKILLISLLLGFSLMILNQTNSALAPSPTPTYIPPSPTPSPSPTPTFTPTIPPSPTPTITPTFTPTYIPSPSPSEEFCTDDEYCTKRYNNPNYRCYMGNHKCYYVKTKYGVPPACQDMFDQYFGPSSFPGNPSDPSYLEYLNLYYKVRQMLEAGKKPCGMWELKGNRVDCGGCMDNENCMLDGIINDVRTSSGFCILKVGQERITSIKCNDQKTGIIKKGFRNENGVEKPFTRLTPCNSDEKCVELESPSGTGTNPQCIKIIQPPQCGPWGSNECDGTKIVRKRACTLYIPYLNINYQYTEQRTVKECATPLKTYNDPFSIMKSTNVCYQGKCIGCLKDEDCPIRKTASQDVCSPDLKSVLKRNFYYYSKCTKNKCSPFLQKVPDLLKEKCESRCEILYQWRNVYCPPNIHSPNVVNYISCKLRYDLLKGIDQRINTYKEYVVLVTKQISKGCKKGKCVYVDELQKWDTYDGGQAHYPNWAVEYESLDKCNQRKLTKINQ